MPMHPEDGRGPGSPWWLACFLPLLLAGCATSDSRMDKARDSASPVLQEIASRLPGDYVSVREEGRPTQTLGIERRSNDEPNTLTLSMIQEDVDGGNIRRYGFELEPAPIENRLNGRFALLDTSDRVRRSCPMRFHLTGKELVGETDPGNCRFGQESESVGLLKEIVFDGQRITIGDRLVNPVSGEPRGDDQVIEFLPAPTFTGWLGVREGEEWRVARDFRLRAGSSVEPLDAADMSLGYAVELNFYRMERGDAGPLMRLTITSRDTGDVLAEAWAEPGSRTIGVALPNLQVGLSLADE